MDDNNTKWIGEVADSYRKMRLGVGDVQEVADINEEEFNNVVLEILGDVEKEIGRELDENELVDFVTTIEDEFRHREVFLDPEEEEEEG